MITHSTEIDRPPEEVFAYLDQPERHGEWQTEIVSASVETPGPVGVGTRVRESRKMGGREQDSSYEITEHDPPRRSAFHGLAGPVRPVGVVTVEREGVVVGAALFRCEADVTRLFQIAARDDVAARELILATAAHGQGRALRLSNAPVDEPASRALEQIGADALVRQHEMRLAL